MKRRKMVAYANWSKEPHLVVPGWEGVKHMNFGRGAAPTGPIVTQGVAGRIGMLNWEDETIVPKGEAGATDLRGFSRLIRLHGFSGDVAYGIDTGLDYWGEHRWDHPVGLIAKALKFNAGYLRASYDFYVDPFVAKDDGIAQWKQMSEYRWERLDMVQGINQVPSVQVIACQQQRTKDMYSAPHIFNERLLNLIATEVDPQMDVCIFAGAQNEAAREVVDAGILKLAAMIDGR